MSQPIPNPYKMGVDNLEIADPITGIWHIERNRSGNWRFTGPGREWSGYHTKSEAIARCKEAIEAARVRGGGEPTMPEGRIDTKPGEKPTADEQRYMDRVRALGCAVADENCDGDIEVHHVRLVPGQRRVHTQTIGLCEGHHRTGGHGVAFHAGQDAWQERYGSIADVLAEVKFAVAETAKLEVEGVVLA